MFLQCCESVSPPCEPNAGVWFYGNRCIGRRSVVSASVVIDLYKIPINQLAIRGIRASRTVSAVLNVPPLITKF